MLHERYRPKSWEEFVGHEDTVKRLRAVIGRSGYTGGALWISGPSGTGKTTLAHLVAASLGASAFDVTELDGDNCNVEAVRALEKSIGLCGGLFGGSGWRVVIVNEAHAMTSRAVQAWLTLLEKLPAKRLVIFTTTQSGDGTANSGANLFGDFDGPLLSRCMVFPLSSYGLKKAFAVRLKSVAEVEHLDGQPLAKYERCIAECHNNLRMAYGVVESGAMLVE